MPEAVRRDLVPGVGDRENDFGTMLREPSKNKKSTSGVVPLKAAEEGINAPRHTARM
jgi:hypothetical protein